MKKLLTKFVKESDGQDLIEYALLAATIALGVLAGMQAVQSALNQKFTQIGQSIVAGS